MNTSCEFAEYWISARVDEVLLPADVAGRLDEHIESCAACRDLLETERARATLLSSALSPAGQQATLQEMKARVLQGARQDSQGGQGRGVRARLWRPGPLGLAVAAALLVGIGLRPLFLLTPPVPEKVEPWQVTYEDIQWELDSARGEGGERLKRETRWVRDLRFDDEKDPSVILDTERVDTRYIQFTDYR